MFRTAWLMVFLLGCRGQPAAPEDQQTRVVAQLKRHPEGARLLREAPVHRLVFADEAGVSVDGTVRLERGQPVAAAASRYAHLLHHLVHGMPFDDAAKGNCDGRLKVARAREEKALALEDRLRRSFRLDPLPPDFIEARVAAYRGRCR